MLQCMMYIYIFNISEGGNILKKLNKIMAVILSVLMVVSVIPVTAFAGNDETLKLWDSTFEDGMDGWRSVDGDGDGYGWEHKTVASNTKEENYSGADSDGCVASASYTKDGALTPENYLVSPVITLGKDYSKPVVKWSVGSADKIEYYAEHYSLYIYVEKMELIDDIVPDVIKDGLLAELLFEETLEGKDYASRYVELDESYLGKDIRLIFVHHDCTDYRSIKIDNVSIEALENVSSVEITGAVEPEADSAPSTKGDVVIKADGSEADGSISSVYWEEKNSGEWTAMSTSTFKTGVDYRICYEITVDGICVFPKGFDNATVNGEKASVIGNSEVSDKIVVAYEWTPVYTVTWDWANETEETYSYVKGSAIEEPRAFTRKGYVFKGWDKEIPSAVTENITFTAVWEKEIYTVIWDVDGVKTEVAYGYGDEIEIPEDPVKDYHNFMGWEPEVPATMADIGTTGDSVTYTAKWEIQQFTVSWIVDDPENPIVVTYDYGKDIMNVVPTRAGYEFVSWDAEIPSTMPAENLVFTSIWKPLDGINYTVNIHTMNVDGTYETSTEVLTGTTESTVEAEYTIEDGFELGENSVTSGAVIGNGSLVLDVYLNRKTVNLVFDCDNGEEAITVSGLYGTEVSVPENPVKEGYVFAEWVDAEGNTAEIPAEMPAEDVAFKATWTPAEDTKYTVNIHTMNADGEYETETEELTGATESTVSAVYEVEDGFVLNEETSVTEGVVAADGSLVLDVYIDRKTVTFTFNPENEGEAITVSGLYGAEVKAPEGLEKKGHTFANWEPEVPATFPVEGAEFKAVWTANQYSLIFNADGGKFADGKEETVVTVTFGDAVTVPEVPSKLGYEFAEWDNDIPEIMTEATDLTFTALWTEAERNVEFCSDGALYEIYNLFEGDAIETPADPEKEGYTFLYWSDSENGEEVEIPAEMPAVEEGVILRYYAVFEINEYKFTWDVDGVTTEETYEYGAEIVAPEAPVKEGYVFAGWSAYTEGMTMPAYDVTAIAAWTAESYTLVFDANGGSNVESITAEYGAEIVAPEDPEKEGYSFAGWDKEVYSVMPDLGENGATETFTASWTINQYTITFVTGIDPEIPAIVQDYATEVTAPEAPEREGYIFEGWDAEIPATMPAEDITITAVWTAKKYNAVFHAGEGKFSDGSDSITVETDYDSIPEATEIPVKEGYVFAGWTPELAPMGVEGAEYTATYSAGTVDYTVRVYTMDTEGNYGEPVEKVNSWKADENITISPEGKTGFTVDTEKSVLSGFIAADGSLVLEVYYSRNQYDLIMDVDGEEITEKFYFEAPVVAPETAEKEGYSFTGWEGLVDVMPAEDVKIVATWEIESYTLIFESDAGVEIGRVTAEYGEEITVPEAPTKEGYTFAGWSEEITSTMADHGDNGIEKTVSAQWTANVYNVTWVVDGVSTVEPCAFGSEIKIYEPKKDGYVFAGWDKTVPETMPAEDLVFIGSWVNATDTKYTVLVYTMKTDGTYGSPSSTIKAGETGATVNAEYTVEDGFVFNSEKSVTSGAIKADGSLVLEVYIDRLTATITFNSNGGSAVEPVTGYYGADIPAVVPVLKGYSFKGWEGIPSKMPYEDITVKAKWEINNYTITFKNIGRPNNEDLVVTYTYGAKVSEPEVTVKTGFEFIGWDSEIPATMPDENLVITAKMTQKKYNATFDANGGKVALDDGTKADKRVNSVSYLAQIKLPADPERAGYIFNGWEGYKQGMTMNAKDVIFVAKWIPAEGTEYTVNIHTMGVGGNYDVESNVYTATTEAKVFAEYTVAEGFELGENSVTSGSVIGDGSLVLDIYLDRKTVTITFDTKGGSEVPAISQLYGSKVNAPADPERAGYIFAGWDKTVPETMPSENVTITAKWTLNTFKATFRTDGGKFADGTDEKAIDFDFGEEIIAPADPERAGYTFMGWYPAPETMPAKNIVLTATWKANTYDAVFKANGGKFADGTVETRVATVFNEQIVAPADPVRAGYIFDGWNAAVGTMTTVGGCAFEAQWKPASDTKYTVNIYTMGTDGNYSKQTSTLAGVTGSVVNANYAVAEGFELSKTKNNVTSGTIAADGSLVLNVYLDRKLVTITFDTKGGSIVEPITQIYGSKINAPASPVRKGYKFTGWTNLPATMPAYDTTVYAIYVCSATLAISNNTGSKTFNYGETLRLTAAVSNLPDSAVIYWYVDGVKRGEGESFDITFESGSKNVSVKLVDKSTGVVIENENGSEIGDTEVVSVNAGFFQKLISFFKNLFGMNRTVFQAFKMF